MPSPRKLRLEVEQPLHAAVAKGTNIRWPIPIDARLDELTERVPPELGNVSRQELAAALVLAARADPTTLGKLITDYRAAKIRDASVNPSRGKIRDFQLARPGRRRRAG